MKISYWSPIKIGSELLITAMKKTAPLYAKGKLIDLGCGTKPYESIFLGHIDSYFGVDSKPTAIVNYADKTKADLYCDCTDTKLPSESFDTVLSTQVLEQILEPEKYITESFRLLKEGSYGIFTILSVWQYHPGAFDYYRFTANSIKELFKRAGYEIIILEPLGGAYASLTQAKIVSLCLRKINNLFLKTLQKISNFMTVPILNWKALHLDKLFWNDKLPLYYLVVVKKV